MEKKDVINVYEMKLDIENVVFSGDRESVRNFIGNTAFTLNCGMYRFWTEDGAYYYDCGPVVYYTKIEIDLEPKHDADRIVKVGKIKG